MIDTGTMLAIAQLATPVIALAVTIGVFKTLIGRMREDIADLRREVDEGNKAFNIVKVASTAHSARVDALLERDGRDIGELRSTLTELGKVQVAACAGTEAQGGRIKELARRMEVIEHREQERSRR